MTRICSIEGHRFGRLIVDRLGSPSPAGKRRWLCRCDCGGSTEVATNDLRRGSSKSCGCLHRESTGTRFAGPNGWHHGLQQKYPGEFTSWTGAVTRCRRAQGYTFERYQGRGIDICEKWVTGENGKSGFICFLEDMGPKPSPMHSIERVDNDGDYEPSNCCWATPLEQAQNQRPKKKRTPHNPA